MSRPVKTAMVASFLAFLSVFVATGARGDIDASAGRGSFDLGASQREEQSLEVRRPSQAFPDTASVASISSRDPGPRIEYRVPCEQQSDQSSGCLNLTGGCPEGLVQFRRWEVSAEAEIPLNTVCVSPVGAAADPVAVVTPGMVLEAFRRVPVPEVTSVSQPGEKTLVNFETIFHARAERFVRTVGLLGRSVRLEIWPSRFAWHHGDGSITVSEGPGAPYPSREVTHRYGDASVTVRHHVVVTWSARWSLEGGAAQPVPGTVTTTGPGTPLRVVEAVPALSGDR